MKIKIWSEEACDRLERNREVSSKLYDKERVNSLKYNMGELVTARDYIPSTGYSRNLRTKYRGPYKFTKVLDNDWDVVEVFFRKKQRKKNQSGNFVNRYIKNGFKTM